MAAASSASFFLFALTPARRLLARSILIVLKQSIFFSSSVIMRALMDGLLATIGMIFPWSWVGTANSEGSLSPAFGALAFFGKMISLLLYSFNLWTLAWRLSVPLFFRLWSTQRPMVEAYFLPMPAVLSSSRVNPLPIRTLVLYLYVGHLTTGLSEPATGRGAMARALAARDTRLLFFLPG